MLANGVASFYCYDNADRLTQVQVGGTIGYDTRGNVTSLFGTPLTWDPACRDTGTGGNVTLKREPERQPLVPNRSRRR